jgi:hypothetical protein
MPTEKKAVFMPMQESFKMDGKKVNLNFTFIKE